MDQKDISDGYHTFRELYDHRHALFIALCRQHRNRAWRAELHADGTMYDDSFIMGLNTKPGLQISYHLPMRLWNDTGFAWTREKAPVWDGHDSVEVVRRLGQL